MAGGIVEAPVAMTGWPESAWPGIRKAEKKRKMTRSDACT
jgi:hypothetical protein